MLLKSSKPQIVLGIDVGTTNIKCHAYDKQSNIIGSSFERLPLLNFKDGRQEIIPDELWQVFQDVVKKCLLSANLKAEDISSLGISTLRGTFLTWDRETGDSFHNFITWKDKRTERYCELWNSSYYMKFLRFGALIMYFFSRKKKFQLLSNFNFSAAMVLVRLYWVFQNIVQIQNKAIHDRILFGTIETWLVWKLTGGKVHATDSSNACATGFFDPYEMDWLNWVLKILHIPSTILPIIKNSCDSYGETLPEIFGYSMPIRAVIGDQQASLFGTGCFEKYDINCTMGTGSFLVMNTGRSPLGAYDGFYPLVGWTISTETTYVVEGGVHDVGTVMSWMQNLGLIDHPEEAYEIASSITDNGDVYFLPGVNGVKKSNVGDFCKSSFIGLSIHTSKEQMIRSILEALAFQVCELYYIVNKSYETQQDSLFRICGGVATNNFIVQLISDVTTKNIQRLKNTESSCLGAAFLAGLYSGIWESQEEIKQLIKTGENFSPSIYSSRRNQSAFLSWKKAYTHPIIAKQV